MVRDAAFDVDDDFMGIVRVFGEVFVEEVERIVVGWTLEFASVPGYGAVGNGCFHCFEGLVFGSESGSPCQTFSRVTGVQ